jgi:plasmid maintenance system antidote protein VapI
VAKGRHIARLQLHNVIGQRSAVLPEMAVRFEKAFGGSAELWLRMQAAFDLVEVRRPEGGIDVERLARPAHDKPHPARLVRCLSLWLRLMAKAGRLPLQAFSAKVSPAPFVSECI